MYGRLRNVILLGLAACAPEGEVATFAGTSDDGRVDYLLTFPEAPVVGEVSPTVELSTPSGEPYEGGALEVEPFMPEHGHGPSDPPVVEERGAGEWTATWTFPMAGSWDVTLRVGGAHEWVADVVVD